MEIWKSLSDIKKSKFGLYCSRRCSAIKNNSCKTTGVKTDDRGGAVEGVELKTKMYGARSFLVIQKKIKRCRKQKSCLACGVTIYDTRKTCSSKCLREKLRVSALKSVTVQSLNRRSLNETLFFDLCKDVFADSISNKAIFNGWDADIIIPSLKIAILWNGKWHYKKITKKHSVLQVQNRDKIKLKEITSCGFTPYVIKDMYKFKKSFVEDQFNTFILWTKTL